MQYITQKKYPGVRWHDLIQWATTGDPRIAELDRQRILNVLNVVMMFKDGEFSEAGSRVIRVSGLKDETGRPLGMFQEGELLWHSNESGTLTFTPGVALYAKENVVGSATGFITTPDYYESVSNAFRSELDEMIIRHEFTPGKINPGLNEAQDGIMHKNMCPEPTELPLVIQSPKGIRGLHYSINTINSIKGMTQSESQAVFDQINKTLFVEKYMYDHWYEQDNDLCLFDNSVTLHRRLGGITNRLCYRIQYQYSTLIPYWNPYLKEPFISDYNRTIDEYKHYDR
jgi:alpha-ketoglutarate-dependent taurine dioxygenase